jgi:hypothetical protein
MTQDEAQDLVVRATDAAASDPESDIVWSGIYEGRPGLRMRQTCREATTVWFTVGQHTVGFEAYLLPAPVHHAEAVYRHCLVRSHRSWPASIAIGPDGDLFILGRIPLDALSEQRLDEAVAAVYEVVEMSFPALLELGYLPRENSR